MTLNEYMKTANEEYKNQQKEKVKVNETAFNRAFLLSIGQCEYTEKEFINLLLVILSPNGEYNALAPDRMRLSLSNALHNHYLLKIDWSGNKPQITEDFEVWYNLQTRELSAVKQHSFDTCDLWVKLNDYRILDGVQWCDLVEK